jgi:hypothetical protein
MSESVRRDWWVALHRFDKQHRRRRGPEGLIGRSGKAVIKALFKLQGADGSITPSRRAIARAAELAIRTTQNALNHLRDLGIVSWQRRCKPGTVTPWVQDTSAYRIRPPSAWIGFKAPPAMPTPEYGRPASMDPFDQWAALRATSPTAALEALGCDPTDYRATALARLGHLIVGTSRGCSGCLDTNPSSLPKREERQETAGN